MKTSRRNVLAAGGSAAMIAMAGSARRSWAQSGAPQTSADLIDAAKRHARGGGFRGSPGKDRRGRRRCRHHGPARREYPRHRRGRSTGHPWPQRLAFPSCARRTRLQPRASLGRSRIAATRTADDCRAGDAHSQRPVGARGRRLVSLSIQGEADADRRGIERRRPGHPGVRAVRLQRGLLNRAGVAALGWTPDSAPPEGGSFEFVDGGAILRKPAAAYTRIGMLPPLSAEDQLNSTQHFLRELNRFSLTSAIDAGGTNLPYPGDYQALVELATRPGFPRHPL
jgi:hypothetical protein